MGLWLRMAAVAAVSMLSLGDAQAVSFDERWKSLYPDSQVAGDPVAAKAEMATRVGRGSRPETGRGERPQGERHRSHRHRLHHHRARGERGERRREWYKGGTKWHYVYARKRRR